MHKDGKKCYFCKLMNTLYKYLICFTISQSSLSQTLHPAVERFVKAEYMKGASLSLMIVEVGTDSVYCSYDAERAVVPASVMKAVTTATALELLGGEFRYATALSYDGVIADSVLKGNLYITGSGDPSLCSAELPSSARDGVMRSWAEAVKKAGIKAIAGSVIANDSIFDTEGVSMKWLREDLGSGYGQGCYGINVFDNRFALYINTELNKALPDRLVPDIPGITLHNYLTVSNKDSCYIIGHPYSSERWLYGTLPAGRADYRLYGDIPDPPLYAAHHLTNLLESQNIKVSGKPSCYRLLQEADAWPRGARKTLITTRSQPLKELVRITNNVSANLYADAFLKTVGLQCTEAVSSFGRGSYLMRNLWRDKGIDATALRSFDGSGLAATDRLSAAFLCDVLKYMALRSSQKEAYMASLPRAGFEGTVKNFLKGGKLEGKARLKSGSMNQVRSYAGYIEANNRKYAVAIIVNNFQCRQSKMKMEIEQLLLALF